MRIIKLEIENLRAIKKISLTSLQNTVVIAGPNGCGKSSIFDAIRLIKSLYGGYQSNEIDQWFNEFQINISQIASESKRMFRNPNLPIRIFLEIILTKSEKDFIRKNIVKLVKPEAYLQRSQIEDYYQRSVAAEIRTGRKKIEEVIKVESKTIIEELNKNSFTAEVIIDPDFKITTSNSRLLELVFSSYSPDNIGIVDYHGPNRTYVRERIGGINLSIESEEQRVSQSVLYNYASKYSNIKSEMAASYIRELISKESGIRVEENNLTKTLKELFSTFFPGKEFLGPQPSQDGNLTFPVKMSTGEVHDVDELSSGEKEVLYGYLRIRNKTPRNSVLLLDEPELHLNPRLIHGLPEFYKKHLGEAMGNQIWLITHSDAFLRETIGQVDYSTYHMKVADKSNENQIKKVDITEDLENAVIDLVGDLATYHPGAKVVIFEGGGSSEFDLEMISSLFPNFVNKVNAISGGSKGKVTELHEMLKNVVDKSQLPMKFFAVVDWDTEDSISSKSTTFFKWDVYHIENYLLDEKYVLLAMQDLELNGNWTIEKIKEELKICANESLGQLVLHKLRIDVNDSIVQNVNIGADPKRKSYAEEIYKSLEQTKSRIDEIYDKLSEEEIQKKENIYRKDYELAIKNNSWKIKFKGRDILKRFVARNVKGTKYEIFRNLIINKMKTDEFQPEGMKKILDAIITY